MANYTLFNLRGDTRANWLAANPILNNRELAMETDTKRFKVGDGTSTYSQLTYGRNTGEYLNFYNVTALFPLNAGYYYTHESAISAVPSSERCKGSIVSYETASGVWSTEQFIGSDVANWSTLDNWEKIPNATDLNGKVSKTGAETIADLKTFTTIPQIPTTDPTIDAQVASKKYVDSKDAQLSSDLKIIPTMIYNKYIAKNGIVSALAGWKYTEMYYSIKDINSLNIKTYLGANAVSYYDKNFIFISGVGDVMDTYITSLDAIPQNAVYVRFSINNYPDGIQYLYVNKYANVENFAEKNKVQLMTSDIKDEKINDTQDNININPLSSIFEYSEVLPNYYINTLGVKTANIEYNTFSDLIPIKFFNIKKANINTVLLALGVAFYDSNKTFISGLGDYVGTITEYDIIIPTTASYINFSWNKESIFYVLVQKNKYNSIADIDAINDNKKEIININNLLNGNNYANIVSNYPYIVGWVNSPTTINTSINYRHTTAIPVNSGDKYIYSYIPDIYFNMIYIVNSCDVNGNPIVGLSLKGISESGIKQQISFKIPEGVQYITLTYIANSTIDTIALIKPIILNSESVKNVLYNSFKNKTAYYLGDSIAHGVEAGGYSFPKWISEYGVFKNNINLARGGWSLSDVLNTEIPKISDLIATYGSPDYIFLMVGTNNFFSGTQIGDWYTTTVDESGNTVRTLTSNTTVKGYINQIMSLLKSNYPQSKIILMTPIRKYNEVGKVNGTGFQGDDLVSKDGVFLDEYRTAYLEAEKVHGCWTFDTWSSSQLDPHNVNQQPIYWTGDNIVLYNGTRFDGVHPNRVGQRKIANSLLGYLLCKNSLNNDNWFTTSTYFLQSY